MSSIRFFRTPALGALVALVFCGCATRRPEAKLAAVPVSRTVVWRVAEGDIVRVRIYREPELSGESAVNMEGTAYFAGLGRIQVLGLSLDSLQADISARYAKFIVEAAVDVTVQRDIVVYGQARTPGVFPVDPNTTVMALLSKAGFAASQGRDPLLTLVRPDGRQYSLPREARLAMIDITRADAVYVQERSMFARNQQSFGAVTLVVTLASSVLGLLLIMAR